MREKVIGVLGGMGPAATIGLYQKIIQNTSAQKDQEHLRVIIDSNPKIPDRSEAIIGQGISPVPLMVQSARSLELAGADFVIIPCVSAHFFLVELEKKINLPVVSALDAVVGLIAEQYQGIKILGLLSTTGTIYGGLFQKIFAEKGVKTLIPDPKSQDDVMTAIYMIKRDTKREFYKESKNLLIDSAQKLIEKGCLGIIAGCTEISLVLNSEDIPVPLFDSLTALARAAIDYVIYE